MSTTRAINALAAVICVAMKTRQTPAGIAVAVVASDVWRSPESVHVSPWQRAVDGLNALVDAGIGFHVEPDGHISNPAGGEHIEWDRAAERWQLVHDEDNADEQATGSIEEGTYRPALCGCGHPTHSPLVECPPVGTQAGA